jgi:hypothetical protein
MAEVPYRSWSLIPRDDDPTEGRPNVTNPPLMTALALDAGSSLCFEIDAHQPSLLLRLNVTGISAEGRADDFLQILTGASEGAFHELPVAWETGQEGLNAVFTATLADVSTVLKLYLVAGPTLVVNKIELEA